MKKDKLPTITINRRALERIDIASLARLSDALHTISDVSNGMLALPCFRHSGSTGWTDAGDLLERLTNFLDCYRTEIIRAISDAEIQDESEAREMVWARLKYEADLGDDLGAFARMVGGLTATFKARG